MNTENHEKLKALYYSPKTGLQGINKLYEIYKITHPQDKLSKKDIKEFINNQAVSQIHKPQTPIKYYFPIKAPYKNAIWQIDLMDVSNMESSNNHTKYLLCAIDIYSRYAYCSPLKNKFATTVKRAMRDILNEELLNKDFPVKVIQCDLGSEFISKEFEDLAKEFNFELSFAPINDKHRQGVIERFNGTVRRLIERYKTAFNTSRYIDVLPDLIFNYNHSPHTSLGNETPQQPDPEKIQNIIQKKELLAEQEETKFEVNNRVRFVKNIKLFEKGALPKFTKNTYRIIGIDGRVYTLDNNKEYKYYQLQRVKNVESLNPETTPIREIEDINLTKNKIKRALTKEGIDPKNIIRKPSKRT